MATRRSALGAGISRAGEAIAAGLNRRYEREIEEKIREEDKRRFDLQFDLTQQRVENDIINSELDRAIKTLGPDTKHATLGQVMELAPSYAKWLGTQGADLDAIAAVPWNSTGFSDLMDKENIRLYNMLAGTNPELAQRFIAVREGRPPLTWEETGTLGELSYAQQVQQQYLAIQTMGNLTPAELRTINHGLLDNPLTLNGVVYRRIEDYVEAQKLVYQGQLSALRRTEARESGLIPSDEELATNVEADYESFRSATSPDGDPQRGLPVPPRSVGMMIERALAEGDINLLTDMIKSYTGKSQVAENPMDLATMKYIGYKLTTEVNARNLSGPDAVNYIVTEVFGELDSGKAAAELINQVLLDPTFNIGADDPGILGDLVGSGVGWSIETNEGNIGNVPTVLWLTGFSGGDEAQEGFVHVPGVDAKFSLKPAKDRVGNFQALNTLEQVNVVGWGLEALRMGTASPELLDTYLPGLKNAVLRLDPSAQILNSLVIASNGGQLVLDPDLARATGRTPYEPFPVPLRNQEVYENISNFFSPAVVAGMNRGRQALGQQTLNQPGQPVMPEPEIGEAREYQPVMLDDIQGLVNEFLQFRQGQDSVGVGRTSPSAPSANTVPVPPEEIPEAPGAIEQPEGPQGLETTTPESPTPTPTETSPQPEVPAAEVPEATPEAVRPEKTLEERRNVVRERSLLVIGDETTTLEDKSRYISSAVAADVAFNEQTNVGDEAVENILRPFMRTIPGDTQLPYDPGSFYLESLEMAFGTKFDPETAGKISELTVPLGNALRAVEEAAIAQDPEAFDLAQAEAAARVEEIATLIGPATETPEAAEPAVQYDTPEQANNRGDPRLSPLSFAPNAENIEQGYVELNERIREEYGRKAISTSYEIRSASYLGDALSVVHMIEPKLADVLAQATVEQGVERRPPSGGRLSTWNNIVREQLKTLPGYQESPETERALSKLQVAFWNYVNPGKLRRGNLWQTSKLPEVRSEFILAAMDFMATFEGGEDD